MRSPNRIQLTLNFYVLRTKRKSKKEKKGKKKQQQQHPSPEKLRPMAANMLNEAHSPIVPRPSQSAKQKKQEPPNNHRRHFTPPNPKPIQSNLIYVCMCVHCFFFFSFSFHLTFFCRRVALSGRSCRPFLPSAAAAAERAHVLNFYKNEWGTENQQPDCHKNASATFTRLNAAATAAAAAASAAVVAESSVDSALKRCLKAVKELCDFFYGSSY